LRLDPPWWDEAPIVPEVTLGKRCARLDLREEADRRTFEELLSEADVLVHGYRADALTDLGFDAERRRQIRPGLVDVSLDAYGWTGPWRHRRGFDSLVQMSTGIAAAGMTAFGKDSPTPLPVQALDQATGYLMATAAVRGLTRRLTSGMGSEWRTSLARVGMLLSEVPADKTVPGITPRGDGDYSERIEETVWGSMRRLLPPATVQDAPMAWEQPAGPLGAASPWW
jgi:crotonobetainyl-CoA:carnitine CoA-transferase CaiB-like acyl-CoA transferase